MTRPLATTGGIWQAFCGGVPEAIADQLWERLDEPRASVAREFSAGFRCAE